MDELLEQISMAKLNDVRYACCYSCAGGCIGGPCVAVNKYVAAKNLRVRVERRRSREDGDRKSAMQRRRIIEDFPDSWRYIKPLEPRPQPPLARDFGEALEKMARLKELEKEFPQLDCGACGAPPAMPLRKTWYGATERKRGVSSCKRNRKQEKKTDRT